MAIQFMPQISVRNTSAIYAPRRERIAICRVIGAARKGSIAAATASGRSRCSMCPAASTLTSCPCGTCAMRARTLARPSVAASPSGCAPNHLGMNDSVAATHNTGAVILLPHGDHFFHPVHRGRRQLVPRIRIQARAAVGLRLRPVAREELRLVARQARIVLLQLIGDRREIRVRSERRRMPQRVEPLGNTWPAPAPPSPPECRSLRATPRAPRVAAARPRTA